MKSEIEEAFEYLSSNPGGITIGERQIVEQYQKHYNEYGRLSEPQTRTLLEIRKWREKNIKHLY